MVLCIFQRLMEDCTLGIRDRGKTGEGGGDRMGRVPTVSPHSHFSKLTSPLGSGTTPYRISPVPGVLTCVTVPLYSGSLLFALSSTIGRFAPCVVEPKMKLGRVDGSGHIDAHSSSKTPAPFCIKVITEEGDILGFNILRASTVCCDLRQTISDSISSFAGADSEGCLVEPAIPRSSLIRFSNNPSWVTSTSKSDDDEVYPSRVTSSRRGDVPGIPLG